MKTELKLTEDEIREILFALDLVKKMNNPKPRFKNLYKKIVDKFEALHLRRTKQRRLQAKMN